MKRTLEAAFSRMPDQLHRLAGVFRYVQWTRFAGAAVGLPFLGAVFCKGTSECVGVVDVLLNCGEVRA